MLHVDLALAQKIAEELNIPPRPEVLVAVSNEAKKKYPKVSIVAEELKSDVGLSSEMLHVVNSPAYGLASKVSSVEHAIVLLGIERVERIATLVAMRTMLGVGVNLGRFWDSASEIAMISCHLARILSGVNLDDAYTIGLFHDCGMPLLMQKFKDYKQTLKEISQSTAYPQTLLEDQRYKCNHALVGFCLCEKWFLPQRISRAILMHHENFSMFQADSEEDNTVITLLAILQMAEYFSACFRKNMRGDTVFEWDFIAKDVLSFMGLRDDDFNNIKVDLLEQLQNI